MNHKRRRRKKEEKQGIIIQIPGSRWSIGASFIFTYPLTVGVVTSQPVSSIFLYSPLPSGTWRTLGLCPFPNVVFPLLFKRGKKTRQTKKKRWKKIGAYSRFKRRSLWLYFRASGEDSVISASAVSHRGVDQKRACHWVVAALSGVSSAVWSV